MIVLSDTENRTIVSSFIWRKHRNETDRRTDRQTDRRTDLPCYYSVIVHSEPQKTWHFIFDYNFG